MVYINLARSAVVRGRRGHCSGFTLIELLVVISVIALLIGILLPVLSEARGIARSSVCKSNQRQIVTAMLNYSADQKDWMVPYLSPFYDPTLTGAPANQIWQVNLIADGYLPPGEQRFWIPVGIDCPVNPNGNLVGQGSPIGDYENGTPDYMYNRDAGSEFVGTSIDPTSRFPMRRMHEMVAPTEEIVLLEAAHLSFYAATPFRSHYFFQDVTNRFLPGDPDYYINEVHNNETSNVPFFDGHIAAFGNGEITVDMSNIFD